MPKIYAAIESSQLTPHDQSFNIVFLFRKQLNQFLPSGVIKAKKKSLDSSDVSTTKKNSFPEILQLDGSS